MERLRVFEAFAGYGSQAMALERLGLDYEVVGISEIDKYAIDAYMAVHGKTRNYGDISKIDWAEVDDFDLLTYSFPCTDISTAGRQEGLAEGSGTRSSLLWECKKAIEAKKPKYLLMENVKALTQKKFMPYLAKWLAYLSSLGYSNHTKVLNAKDYGVPQNRERVFVVSISGEERYSFPKPFGLDKRLKDVLEDDVDESYYLSERMLSYLVNNDMKMREAENGHKFKPKTKDDVAFTIRTAAGSRMDDNFIKVRMAGNTNPSGHGMNGNVFHQDGLSPTLTTGKGEGVRIMQPKIAEPVACAMRGRNPDNPSDRNPGKAAKQMVEVGGKTANCITTVQKDSMVAEPNNNFFMYKNHVMKDGDGLYTEATEEFFHGGLDGVSRTLKAECHDAGVVDGWRIRKLTPRECFRLMGVSETDIDKIQASGISKTQQYKMAGNSIVVDVLYHIFRKLFVDKGCEEKQLELF